MAIDEILSLIICSVVLLMFVGLLVYILVKYGIKQIELDYKCRKAQLHFYESASKLIDKDLVENGNKQAN